MLESGYKDRFGGVERLLGAGTMERLAAAHVCVVGLGGVGSWTVEALARSGVGALTLIDLDDVCVTNTNRQLPALSGTVGLPKVSVLAERVAQINPDARVQAVAEFFSEATAARMLEPRFDVVIDAIDALSNKARLIAAAKERGLPVLTVGGAGGKRDATQVKIGDLGDAFSDEMLRQLRRKLRRDHGFAPGTTKGRMNFGVRCVWSNELPVYPWADGVCRADPEPGSNLRMDCASGFGAGVWVTGTFGLYAAQEAVRMILDAKP